jgi:hypothetical protein
MPPLRALTAAVLLLAACASAPPAGVPAGPDAGDRWEEVRARGAGTATVLYVPAEGWAYRDGEGRLTGVTVELMRLFAEHLRTEHGVALELRFVEEPDWRTFYRRVREGSGGVFGIGNVTITEPRRAELRFSPPYLTSVATLITREDVPELARLEEIPSTFEGLAALAFEGTLHEERLRRIRAEHHPELAVELARSNREILDRVAAGGYFAYVDVYNYHGDRRRGAPLRNHPAADDPAEEFGIVMPLDADWGPVVDAFFAHGPGLRRTAAYRALLEEHLGPDLARTLLEAAER